MTSYAHRMQEIFKQYQSEVSSEPVDLREVGAWAIKNRLWAPRPVDIQLRFASEMAEALREEYRTDKAGRRYRSKLAVTFPSKDGRQGSLWGDMDTSPRPHVVKNISQRRRQSSHDLFQIRKDVDHYNEAHQDEEKIKLPLDFTEDIDEMLAAAGLKKAG